MLRNASIGLLFLYFGFWLLDTTTVRQMVVGLRHANGQVELRGRPVPV